MAEKPCYLEIMLHTESCHAINVHAIFHTLPIKLSPFSIDLTINNYQDRKNTQTYMQFSI